MAGYVQAPAADRPASAEEVSQRLGAIDIAAPWSSEQARQWWADFQPADS